MISAIVIILGLKAFISYRNIEGIGLINTVILMGIICLFVFNAIKQKIIINPFTLYLLLPISLFLYDQNVSTHYLVKLTQDTYNMAFYNMVMYFLGLLFMLHLKIKLSPSAWSFGEGLTPSSHARIAFKMLIVGMVPSVLTLFMGLSAITNMNTLRSIYGGIPLASVLSLLLYPGIFFAFKSGNRRVIIMAVVCILINLYTSFSKSTLTMLCTTMLIYIYVWAQKDYRRKKWLTTAVIVIVVVVFLSFEVYNNIRFEYNLNDYFDDLGYVGNISNSMFLPYMYITSPWSNVQNFLETTTEFTHGLWLLKPFLGYAQLDSLFLQSYELVPRFSAFNTYTYISVFFLDFGVFGSGICSFFLAMYTMYLYRMFLLYSESPLIQGVYALNVYAMFMMFFNNHFLQLSYPITIVLIAWAINRFNRRRLQQENKEK